MRFPDVPREIADIGLSCPDMDHCRQRMTHRPTVTGTLLELIWRTTETTALNPLGAAFWKRCCEFVTRVRETFIFSGRNPGNQRLPKGLQASVSKDSRSNQRLDRRFSKVSPQGPRVRVGTARQLLCAPNSESIPGDSKALPDSPAPSLLCFAMARSRSGAIDRDGAVACSDLPG